MSAVAIAPPAPLGKVGACGCGFGVWSHPWPGRPRTCIGCGLLNADDLPCKHLHFHGGTDLCEDCDEPPDTDSKRYATQRAGECRPAGLVLADLAICTAVVLSDLSEPKSAERPCGYVTKWRLGGKPWCPRCWWLTKAGAALTKELRASIQP